MSRKHLICVLLGEWRDDVDIARVWECVDTLPEGQSALIRSLYDEYGEAKELTLSGLEKRVVGSPRPRTVFNHALRRLRHPTKTQYMYGKIQHLSEQSEVKSLRQQIEELTSRVNALEDDVNRLYREK